MNTIEPKDADSARIYHALDVLTTQISRELDQRAPLTAKVIIERVDQQIVLPGVMPNAFSGRTPSIYSAISGYLEDLHRFESPEHNLALGSQEVLNGLLEILDDYAFLHSDKKERG